jgi:hypothetical protein
VIDEKKKDDLENLRRYQNTRREQLGAAVNLILGLAAAATGFCVSQVIAKETRFSVPGTYVFLCATLLFILTVGICMLTTWTRLRNFGATANKLRAELRDAPIAETIQLNTIADRLGRRTWFLFRAQSITFVLGVFLLAVSLWLLYSDHLFPKSLPACPPPSADESQIDAGK